MSESLLQNKQFFCREWVFGKIQHCLESRQNAKTCGVLVMGGPGCGKTAICTEIVWPTLKQGKQKSLRERLLAYHFCQAHDTATLSVSNFVARFIEQLSESDLLPDYKSKLKDNCICQSLLASPESKPDEIFTECVIRTLNDVKPPKESLFMLIDSIDESLYEAACDNATGMSKTIADLISKHHHMFPSWLILICSSRKQSKSVTRLFTGFRKISLDDLRKSHVVRDVQQYILCRLDSERELRQHLSKETAEMLNQLHIKSNGCFLYLERVLDGVAENFVMLREIREIPGTLNGLYLWLCQRLFIRKQFYKIQPILNVILATRQPLCANNIYKCAKTHCPQLTREDFDRRLKLLSKILIDGPNESKLLFHHSFAEWLLDVKHCTQKYLCNAADGHGMLAMNYTLNANSLSPADVQEFTLHLVRCNSKSILEQYHLVHWLLLSGANITTSLSSGLPNDPKVLNLLNTSGATIPRMFASMNENLQTSTVQQYSVEKTVDAVKLLEQSTASINEVEMSDRRLDTQEGKINISSMQQLSIADIQSDSNSILGLHIASQQGNLLMVDSLLASGVRINDPDDEGWTALRTASWGGHTEVVDFLLQSGAIVDCTGKDNRTALRAAAWGGHEEILKKLIAHGAEVNKVDNEGRTALIAAAYMGHRDIVAYLIEHGADINHEDCDGRTGLSVAALCIPASEGHSDVVGLLLEHGTEVDHRDKEGVTPLLVAAYEGHHDVCELLLEWDADVDHSDSNNRTPLLAAASMGHASVVNQLLFWGAAVDTIDGEGRTVLSIAAAHGSISVVQTLLDRGLDEMHRDNAGWTPLHMAAYEGHTQVCAILVQHGAKVNDPDNDGRHALILAAQEGHEEVVKTLLHYNSDLNHKSHDGKTAFRVACLECHEDVAHVLICEGTNINYQDADGRSTLYICALENKVTVANYLMENGAEAEGFDLEGRTPLHVASWQGHYQMVQLLLKYHAYVDSMDNDQRTPLQSASWQGHDKVVRLLLEHGAKVDHSCNQGATALCIAAQEGHEEVVRVLLEYKANPGHSDQFGRTAMKVASKSGHTSVIKLLEQFGVSPASSTHSRKSERSSSSTDNKPPSMYVNVNVVNGIALHSSPSDSPESTFDRRKSYISNHSSKSSMLTSTNSSSIGHSLHNSDSLTFTQQLQQCSMPRNRSRPISRLLTPVSEPHSPLQSPVISPVDTPCIDVLKLTSDEHVNLLSPSPVKYTGSKREKIAATINIYTNPNEDLMNGADDPVWKINPQFMQTNNLSKSDAYRKNSSDRSPQTIMGQSMLQNTSPELKIKRNGIVTNPNCKKSPPPSGSSSLNDSIVISSGNINNNHKNNMNQVKYPRPNGLALKKETPL